MLSDVSGVFEINVAYSLPTQEWLANLQCLCVLSEICQLAFEGMWQGRSISLLQAKIEAKVYGDVKYPERSQGNDLL